MGQRFHPAARWECRKTILGWAISTTTGEEVFSLGKAIVFERCGEPTEVLQLLDVPQPKPAHGQVRVRMLASPINPSDLLYVRGIYGAKPTLPATPGFEGVGVVEESGGGLLGWRVRGRRVAVLNGQTGNWQEQTIIPAERAIPVPDDLPDEQVASFFVNPGTVVAMVERVLNVPHGAWLLQTAAGSALGRMVIRLGKYSGFRTLNVIRRPEAAAELKHEGADELICTATESLTERVQALTGGKGVPFALDAVGGAMGGAAIASLARRGRMLVYGVLSGEPAPIDPRVLIVGQKRVEGFWLKEWMDEQNLFKKIRLLRRIIRLMRAGVLTTPVAESYPLERIGEAVRAAEVPGRSGKILLRIGQR
jgi:NADPH:quinone reductase-like Zn-dependent oxidoreductase